MKRHSANVEEENSEDRGDGNPLELPPRMAARFRDFSVSPQPSDRISPPSADSDTPPPMKPPRRIVQSKSGGQLDRLSAMERPEPHLPPPPPIVPYSVTTITPMDSDSHVPHPSKRSESPIPIITAPIPPPPILHRRPSDDSAGVYYSTPAELSTSRILSERGTFVDREIRASTSHSSVESGREGLRPRLGEGTQAMSSYFSEQYMNCLKKTYTTCYTVIISSPSSSLSSCRAPALTWLH